MPLSWRRGKVLFLPRHTLGLTLYLEDPAQVWRVPARPHLLVHRVGDEGQGYRRVAVDDAPLRVRGYLPPADGLLEGAPGEPSPLRRVRGNLDCVFVGRLVLPSLGERF